MAVIFGNIPFDVLAIVAIIFLIFYFYIHFFTYSYWKRHGVGQISPSFPFGNFRSSFMQTTHIGLYLRDVYQKSKEPFVGFYAGFKPILLVNDPALVHCIFNEDFQHFQDRGFYIDEEREPLSAHLFSLKGDNWKNLRSKLSPTFTPGKLRAMFPTILECAGPLIRFMDVIADEGKSVDVREILAQYTTNIIASVAFGIDIDCFSNPNEPFRKYGKQFFEPTLGNSIRSLISFAFPALMPLLNLRMIDKDIENFIFSIVRESLTYREKNNVTRKDFFQLLVQLRNTGNVQADDDWETEINHDETNMALSIEVMAAQTFLFLIAGFETSSSTMSYCLYELARNTEYQGKVQQEIDIVLSRYNGDITYESVSEMHLLDRCIDETLRLHPPLLILNRECTKDWQIPKSDVIIKKGTPIVIPAFAMQRDAKYYESPDEFIPDRFIATNISEKKFIAKPYMPFGQGPRLCIGMRLGKMQSKVGLILMLKNYYFSLIGNSLKPLVINPRSFVMAIIDGIPLKVAKR